MKDEKDDLHKQRGRHRNDRTAHQPSDVNFHQEEAFHDKLYAWYDDDESYHADDEARPSDKDEDEDSFESCVSSVLSEYDVTPRTHHWKFFDEKARKGGIDDRYEMNAHDDRSSEDHSQSISDLVSVLLHTDSSYSHHLEPRLRRRLKDFRFAQRERLKKYSIKPFGIIGLFSNLSDIRKDLRWAEDVAWRREHGKPYISWADNETASVSGFLRPYFTYILIVASIAAMFYAFHLNNYKFEDLKVNPLLGPSPTVLLEMGALQTKLVVIDREWYRLIYPVIMHAGLLHLFINLLAVALIGPAVERNHGTLDAAILFVIPAIGGNIMSAVMQPGYILVGASGGIFGLIGVCVADIALNWKLLFLVLEQKHGSSFWRYMCCVFWLCFDLVINSMIGFTPFVDNFAHLGGFIYGFLIALTRLERLPLAFFGKGTSCCYKFRIASFRILGAGLSMFLVIISMFLLLQSDGVTSPCFECRYISCTPFPFWTEDKWWYCDGCDAVSGDVYYHNRSLLYGRLDLFCPDGQVVTLDIYPDRISELKVLQNAMPSYCRDFC